MLVSPEFLKIQNFTFGSSQSSRVSSIRSALSSQRSSVSGSINGSNGSSIDDLIDRLRSSNRRSTVRNTFLESVATRRKSIALKRESDGYVAPSTDFLRNAVSRRSTMWERAGRRSSIQPLESDKVFLTGTELVQAQTPRRDLKSFFKAIVNGFHLIRFLSKCLKNRLERGLFSGYFPLMRDRMGI